MGDWLRPMKACSSCLDEALSEFVDGDGPRLLKVRRVVWDPETHAPLDSEDVCSTCEKMATWTIYPPSPSEVRRMLGWEV